MTWTTWTVTIRKSEKSRSRIVDFSTHKPSRTLLPLWPPGSRGARHGFNAQRVQWCIPRILQVYLKWTKDSAMLTLGFWKHAHCSYYLCSCVFCDALMLAKTSHAVILYNQQHGASKWFWTTSFSVASHLLSERARTDRLKRSQKDTSFFIIFHSSCSSYCQELRVHHRGGSCGVAVPASWATRQTWFLAGRLTPSASQSIKHRDRPGLFGESGQLSLLAKMLVLALAHQVAQMEWRRRLQSQGSQSALRHAVKIFHFRVQKRITHSLKTQFSPRILSWKWL